MKIFKQILFLLVIFLISYKTNAQKYIIDCQLDKNIDKISRIVSIFKIKNDTIFAYASQKEFEELSSTKIKFNYTPINSIKKSYEEFDCAKTVEEFFEKTCYPSYPTYLDLMDYYQKNYPEITRLDTIGFTNNNHNILSLNILANQQKENKAKVFISSTIHGDETFGYYFCLKLIDYLLKNYKIDSNITNLLDNIDIYINPLFNVDGTYNQNDENIYYSKRYNYSEVDLNRNFPQINQQISKKNPSPEKEVEAMMEYCKNQKFDLACYIHGGNEVVNYPWDSFYPNEFILADKAWFEEISNSYVEQSRKVDNTYLTELYPEGIIFGSLWYRIFGGMQDYLLYFERTRGVTLELNRSKTLNPELLQDYFNKNIDAIINYIGYANQGIKGCVSDIYGNKLEDVEIMITNHDTNNSTVFSKKNGNYIRLVSANQNYQINAYKEGYIVESKIVETLENQLVEVNFVLQEGQSERPTQIQKVNDDSIEIIQENNQIIINNLKTISNIKITNTLGQIIKNINCNDSKIAINTNNIKQGIYVIKIESSQNIKTQKIFIKK